MKADCELNADGDPLNPLTRRCPREGWVTPPGEMQQVLENLCALMHTQLLWAPIEQKWLLHGMGRSGRCRVFINRDSLPEQWVEKIDVFLKILRS